MIYNAATPSHLDLGAALAAFGLIFAAYQFRRPQWDLILKIRPWWQRNLVWIFGGVGLATVLFGVVIFEFFSVDFLPYPLTLPLFYEIIAYLFFIASPLSLIFFSRKTKKLFRKKTAKKFYDNIITELSKNDSDGINSALEVLLLNLKDLCLAAKISNDIDHNQIAIQVLSEALSDASIVNILTTKRLDALIHIFKTIEALEMRQDTLGAGMSKIIQQLFLNEESFFYKHFDETGVARSMNIYEYIFGSPTLLKNFDLFTYLNRYNYAEKYTNKLFLDVFIKAILKSISVYLKFGTISPQRINSGLSCLSDIFGEACRKINMEEKRGVETEYALKNEWDILRRISFFIEHEYVFLGAPDYPHEASTLSKEVAKTEKATSDAKFNASTINAAFAALIYKAFEQLSYIKDTTSIDHIVLNLLNGMIYEEGYQEGYREPFEKKLWEKIADNIVNRRYPRVLRVYLQFIGFSLAEQERVGWIGEQTEKMRRLLYIDLKPLLDQKAEMTDKHKMQDALLPNTMQYRDGKFIYKTRFGSGEERDIAPPPEGSNSVFEGMDLKNMVYISHL